MRRMRLNSVLLVFLCLVCGCENSFNSDVPSYPVNFELDIVGMYPHFIPENGFPQTMTFTEKRYVYDAIGFSGLLVWINMEGKYCAADLCCPHCLSRSTRVEAGPHDMYAVCPKCGEQYELTTRWAMPTKIAGNQPLRSYEVTVYPTGKILIRN